MQALKTPDQPPEEILRPPTASRADAEPACSVHTHAGNSSLTDPAAGPDVGVPCVVAPWLELSPAWSSTWAPFVWPLWMGTAPSSCLRAFHLGPKLPSSPELCPLPPFPSGDPRPNLTAPAPPPRPAGISSSSDPSPATRPNQGTHGVLPREPWLARHLGFGFYFFKGPVMRVAQGPVCSQGPTLGPHASRVLTFLFAFYPSTPLPTPRPLPSPLHRPARLCF